VHNLLHQLLTAVESMFSMIPRAMGLWFSGFLMRYEVLSETLNPKLAKP